LSITLESQLAWESEFIAFRAWREAAERIGLLICQFPGKDLLEVRGTSILHFPLPVVGISSKEIPLSKPFTLFHEIVHIALAASDEEKPAASEHRPEPDWLRVERFCDLS
jgi:hypothetical protein